MRRLILSLGFMFFSGILLTTLPTPVHAEQGMPTQEWTQGQFALWLVEAAGAISKLPPAATGVDAITFLNKLGVAPEGGWKKDEKITKEFLLSLLGDDKEGAEGLSFEDLIKRVQDRVTVLFNQWHEAYFSGTSGSSIT